MELRVHKISQAASGGNHVTVYEAEVRLVPCTSDVQVVGVQHKDAPLIDVIAAMEAIRRGAEQVLCPLGFGAIIRVTRLVIHPVDFKARKFEQYTSEELRRLLEAGTG